jgi:hypothetical protein
MKFNRRDALFAGLAGAAAATFPTFGKAADPRTVRVGIGFKAMSPGVINL